MTTDARDIMERPKGSNADEWHLFLCEWLDSRATAPSDGLSFIAVQIADAIDEQIAALRQRAEAAERARDEWREAAHAWHPWPPPKDGEWVIALVNDGCQTIRVSWGNDRHGEPNWCSTDRSYGAGLFKAWIAWPTAAALTPPASATKAASPASR